MKIEDFVNLLNAEGEVMRIKLDEGAKVSRAHKTDAGLDLYSRVTTVLAPKSRVFFDTGVHIELPPFTMGEIRSKSGLMKNHGITTDGTIDVGYTGAIGVTLFNNSNEYYTVNKGDKIAQLVIVPIVIPKLEEVDELDETERGEGGFGSTGR